MKINVLQKRCEFVAVSKGGGKLFLKDLIVQYKGNSNLGIRIGYTASKKVGGAVQRNRAKRRMRAAVRDCIIKNIFTCKDIDIVFIAKTSVINTDWDSLLSQFVNAIGKIFKNT